VWVTIDDGGMPQGRRELGAYGDELVSVGSSWTPKSFHGMFEEDGNGLIAAGPRHLMADNGTWLQPEPLLHTGQGLDLGDPRTFAAYRYGANNPTGYTDRSGYAPEGGHTNLTCATNDCPPPPEPESTEEQEPTDEVVSTSAGKGQPKAPPTEEEDSYYEMARKWIHDATAPDGETSDGSLPLPVGPTFDGEVGPDGELVRRGISWESTGRLNKQALAAEKAGFARNGVAYGHGVSVTTPASNNRLSRNPSDSLAARRKDFEAAGFSIRYTPTSKDNNHHTVQLPKPVTSTDAKRFNELLGRRK